MNDLATGRDDPARSCRVASAPEQVLDAWTLVHDVYLADGHVTPQPGGLYTTLSALHPDTVVFNAYEGPRVVATLTAIPDGPFGLPPEDGSVTQEGFGAEIARLREAGEDLLFCGQFVSAKPRPDDPPQVSVGRLEQTFELFAMLAQHIAHRPRLRVLANPIPRHARFYRRFLGFERVGGVRAYGHGGVQSVLLVTTFERLQAAPRLPASIAAALTRPAPVGLRGVTTATLELPRMRTHIAARWGSDCSVLTRRAEELWT